MSEPGPHRHGNPLPLTPEAAERRRQRRELVRAADMSTVGLVFPVAVVIGYFAGGWIGARLGARETGVLVGILVGVAAGFYNLWKVIVQLRRQEERRSGHPEGTAGERPEAGSGDRP